MNNKLLLGKTLQMMGIPATYPWLCCLSGQMKHLVWTVPVGVMTLPLLPLWLIGDNLVKEVEEEEFSQRTKDFPTVDLPEHYLWIVKINDEWRVEPFCMDGEEDAFESETEARLFVETLQYKEVISKDCQDHRTFWIKNVPQSGAKTL